MERARSSVVAIASQVEVARRFRASAGLVTLGLIWGLVVPLSGMAAALGASALSLTAWVSAVSAVLCLFYAVSRRRSVVLSRSNTLFLLVWAVLGTVVPQTLLFWVASRLPACSISIILILEGFMVFCLAAIFRLEAPTLRRLVGLALGFAGIVPVLLGADAAPELGGPLVVLAVLGVPLCYAVENLVLRAWQPTGVDPVAGVGVMQALGALMSFGLAWLLGCGIWPESGSGRLGVLVLLLGLCAAVANYLFQKLIASTGSVFAGQASYLITLAGIGWSMLLLDEAVSAWVGLSLAPIFLGMLLVTPASARRR